MCHRAGYGVRMQLDPRGQIDMMILSVLGDGEWVYGRGLIQELRDRSDGEVDLPEGTAYPALHRLMAAGLLERRDEYVGHRQRRYYRLNDRGRLNLADRQQRWQRLTAVVHQVMFGPGPVGGPADAVLPFSPAGGEVVLTDGR